jgi:hypothetical protein
MLENLKTINWPKFFLEDEYDNVMNGIVSVAIKARS